MTMMWQCHLSSSECRCYRLHGFSLFKRLPIPLSSGSRTLEQSVGEWLEAVGLQQYESKLLLNGFDDVRFLVSAGLLGPAVGTAPAAGQTVRRSDSRSGGCHGPSFYTLSPSTLLCRELFASLHPKKKGPSPVSLSKLRSRVVWCDVSLLVPSDARSCGRQYSRVPVATVRPAPS